MTALWPCSALLLRSKIMLSGHVLPRSPSKKTRTVWPPSCNVVTTLTLQLRIGLNSGRVIAGKIGSGSLGYRATGEPVVLAQRMESAAPPGGVMLSESTARLVDHVTELSEPEWVRVKGVDEPVCARRLLAIGPRAHLSRRAEAELVGRRWEMAALEANLDRAIRGHGGLVDLVGPPGIGKSRVAREVASIAKDLGVEVFWAFCESHASDMPFYVVAQLLRAVFGVANLDVAAARTRVAPWYPAQTRKTCDCSTI